MPAILPRRGPSARTSRRRAARQTTRGGGLHEARVDHAGRIEAAGFFIALDQLVDEALEVACLERRWHAQDVVGPEGVGDGELTLVGGGGPFRQRLLHEP